MTIYFALVSQCHDEEMAIWSSANSIDSWEELTHQFISNFSMTCDLEENQYDLEQVIQKYGEFLHIYVKRWCHMIANISNMRNEMAIDVFHKGLKELSQKLVQKDLITFASMFLIASKYTMSKEVLQQISSCRRDMEKKEQKTNPNNNRDKKRKVDH